MKLFLKALVVITLLSSCESGDDNDTPNFIERTEASKIITIGEYNLEFTESFDLIPEQGIDSFVGRITNNESTLRFDHGYFGNDFSGLDTNEFDIMIDNDLGQERKIIFEKDTPTGFIGFFIINEETTVALSITGNNLNEQQQLFFLDIFENRITLNQ